jgi:hypothetical protein
MRKLFPWLFSGLLLSSTPVANAAPVKNMESKPLPQAAAGAATPKVVRLTILPAQIQLDGPTATHHLVVMGAKADGAQVDLTSQATITSSAPKIAAVSGDGVRARGDGRAVVTAQYAGLAARAGASVKNTARPVSYSFQNDVVPVMARLGCSAGSCHGANSGKGGFKLSLRGYAPELDFLAVTRQYGGRRICREAPEQSLFLRKPMALAPHGGGKVLEKGTRDYDVLLGWLLQGAPGVEEKEPKLVSLAALPGDRSYRANEKQRLLIQARFSDGRTEDVTDRALFRSNDAGVAGVSPEGEVQALTPGATAIQAKYMDQLSVVRVTVPYPLKTHPSAFGKPGNYVDEAVYAKLRELNLEPSPPCTDEEFARRAYVDVLGTLPTVEEVRRFLDSKAPDKREKLIDEVLARPEYASLWALRLCDVSMVRKEHMQRKNTVAVNQWLTEQFLQNRPWDQLVTDLLTAKGSIEENPQTLWWASRQNIRPNGRGWVRHYELTGEIVAQVFLGQRIQCSKCHNHPAEKYTQDDYYHFAAIFAQVNGEGNADPVPDRFVATDPGEVRQPRTNAVMVAQPLDHADLKLQPGDDRRVKFAEWLTGAGREYFSRNVVNRIWARLFGSGIVDPVDDLRSTNPPRNEALIDALAKDLIARHYDLKYLMGTIMRSRTYQASSAATPGNKVDTQFFSHYPVRRLQAEEMLDAISQVTGVPDKYATYPLGTRAIELSDTELPALSLDTFGRPARTTPCECDRGTAPSMSQALELFNGETLQGKLKNPEGTLALLLKSGKPDAAVIEELFLTALARRPTQKELADTLKVVAGSPSRDEAMQDVLWALINSKEFMFNH